MSTVLDNHDGELMPTLRRIPPEADKKYGTGRADIVITHPSNDYHPDHRYTSLMMPRSWLFRQRSAPDTPPLKKNPVFFWSDTSAPDIAVDIDNEADQKLYAAAAHESQFFEWLPWLDCNLIKLRQEMKKDLNL